jgi:hypothetical protein
MENPSVGSPAHAPRHAVVLFSGIVTSALTLWGVHYLDTSSDDFQIMGFYADYLIPVGPIIAGFAAGSGYGLASWITGTKITSRVLAIMLALLLAGYFGARFIEFRSLHLVYQGTGDPISFWTYIDFVTRSFAWKKEGGGGAGEPFGAWGYGMLALEIAGFTLGGLAITLGLRLKPYCENCQVYMKSKKLALLPASIPTRKVKKSDADAVALYEREKNDAFQKGKALADSLQQQASSIQPRDFAQTLGAHQMGHKEYAKLPIRIQVELAHCPNCRQGLASAAFHAGSGKQLKVTPIFKVAVPSAFVDGLGLQSNP